MTHLPIRLEPADARSRRCQCQRGHADCGENQRRGLAAAGRVARKLEAAGREREAHRARLAGFENREVGERHADAVKRSIEQNDPTRKTRVEDLFGSPALAKSAPPEEIGDIEEVKPL